MEDVQDQLSDISTEAVGVFVQASTLGSLEALMNYLKSCKIPVSNVGLGKLDVIISSKNRLILKKKKRYGA